MYISYLNFVINKPPEKIKKPPQMLNLRQVYNTIADSKFPRQFGNLKVTYMEMCSNSQGCAPKKSDGTRRDYTIAMKDARLNIKSNNAQNDSKNVLLNIKALYTLGNDTLNVALRIPRSGSIGVRVGMSTQSSITVSNANTNADSLISTFMNSISDIVFTMIPQLQRTFPTALVGMKVSGFNIINPATGERPDKPIKNFLGIARMLDNELPDHSLDFSQRNGKQVLRANFKPDNFGEDATIGLTRWGMVDFLGKTSIKRIRTLSQQLITAFSKHTNHVLYNNTVTKKPTSTGKKASNGVAKGCPKSTPPAVNGNCQDPNRIPVPNKHGALCCKKYPSGKTLPPSMVQKLVSNYARANKNIPNSLRSRFSANQVVRNQPRNLLYNNSKKYWTLNGSKFNCMATRKDRLQQIAKSLGSSSSGSKKDLCSAIEARLLR